MAEARNVARLREASPDRSGAASHGPRTMSDETKLWVIGHGYDLFVIRADDDTEALGLLEKEHPGYNWEREDVVITTEPLEGPAKIIAEYIL